MQDHVELEVSLEIIMERIAQKMFEVTQNATSKNLDELNTLMEEQDEAYRSNRQVVEKILNCKGE